MESLFVLLALVALVVVFAGFVYWQGKNEKKTLEIVDEITKKQPTAKKAVDPEFLNKMTKAEIKSFADKNQITVSTSLKKADMISEVLKQF